MLIGGLVVKVIAKRKILGLPAWVSPAEILELHPSDRLPQGVQVYPKAALPRGPFLPAWASPGAAQVLQLSV